MKDSDTPTDLALQEALQKIQQLETIIDILPGHVYWKDKTGKYLGCNAVQAQDLGFQTAAELIGKTDYDFSPKDVADAFKKIDAQVIETTKPIEAEEIAIQNNQKRIMLSTKVPLKNISHKIEGIIGVSIDITDRKELERLRIEKLEEQEKFVKTVLQVVHDIRSPLMIMDILSGETSHFPEDQRVMMRNAAKRINDITNNLLNTYKSNQKNSSQKLPLFVFLSRLFSEKQLQYTPLNIQFKIDIAADAYFAFTRFCLSDLQRLISNLINNAAEAILKDGLITIALTVTDSALLLNIEDNGKGIPKAVLDKLGEVVSYDKASGTGLGLSHAIETVKSHQGKFEIESELGKGTKIILTLPKSKAPDWFAQDLKISSEDVIVIIDDDASIHYLWDRKFAELKLQNPIHHFHFDYEFEKWVAENSELLSHVILLSDNELIGSELQGLALIEKYQSQVKSTLLVTSYYAFHELAEELTRIKTKLLPKELVMHLAVETTPSA